jgi:hypothetical protein
MESVKAEIMRPGFDSHNKSVEDTKLGFLNPIYDRLLVPVEFMWRSAGQVSDSVRQRLPKSWWSKL